MISSLRLRAGLIATWLATVPAFALTVRPPSFAELVAEADTIVLATVTEVSARRVTTAAGHEVIKTFVRVRVEQAFKGEPGAEFDLVLTGGQVGNERLLVPGLPQFEVGATEFLFLAGNGRVMCPLIAAAHGAYPVVQDPVSGEREVRRRNGRPLTSIAEIGHPLDEPGRARGAQPLAARPLRSDEFASHIATALAGKLSPAR